jgi:hypothetical protein
MYHGQLMPQTPLSTATPYCTNVQFFQFYKSGAVRDTLRVTPDSPPPSLMAMQDATNPAGAMLLTHLQGASGVVESNCQVGNRYLPVDLQALTGATQTLLQRITASWAMWTLYQSLKPGAAKIDDSPGASWAQEMLNHLAKGDRIFSTIQAGAAGLPSIVPTTAPDGGPKGLVRRANPVFGTHGGRDRRYPG